MGVGKEAEDGHVFSVRDFFKPNVLSARQPQPAEESMR